MGEQGSLTPAACQEAVTLTAGIACHLQSATCCSCCSLLPEAAPEGLLALKLREMIPQPEHVEPLVFGFYSLEQQGPGSQDLNCSLWLCQCRVGTAGAAVSPLPLGVLSRSSRTSGSQLPESRQGETPSVECRGALGLPAQPLTPVPFPCWVLPHRSLPDAFRAATGLRRTLASMDLGRNCHRCCWLYKSWPQDCSSPHWRIVESPEPGIFPRNPRP